MQVITVSALMGRREGLHPELAQESTLTGFARAANRPVVALESIALQMDTLLPKDAATARTAFEEGLRDLEAPDARQKMKHIAEVWERGDLEAMDTIEEVMKSVPVLAAVGILHMTGDKALPKLLAEMGFEVTRIAY
jgi:uncharacterized protein YbaP (TraB family)